MFGSLSWERLFVLGILALLIFGPERLPTLARDAGRALRKLRETALGAREQLSAELGPEFGDLDLASLNPRTFVRKHLLDGDPDGLLSDPFGDTPTGTRTPTRSVTPLTAGELAPYDLDAT
jgi:sec-independent protein translocase protein TatB